MIIYHNSYRVSLPYKPLMNSRTLRKSTDLVYAWLAWPVYFQKGR